MRQVWTAAAVVLSAAILVGCGPKEQGAGVAPAGRGAKAGQPARSAGSGGKRVLMVLAPGGFRDEEYSEPYGALVASGASVTVASKGKGPLTGAGGLKVQATEAAARADVAAYDAVVFVGGPGMVPLLGERAFVNLAKQAQRRHKLIGAICVAPSILANAGILKGVAATAFPDQVAHLKAAGAQVVDQAVVTTPEIITANGPESAREFGQALAEGLASR
jgi:protease I